MTARVQEHAEALEQLGGRGLDNRLPRCHYRDHGTGRNLLVTYVVVESVCASHIDGRGRWRRRWCTSRVHSRHVRILVAVQRYIVRQRRPERSHALAFAFQFLLIVVRRREPLPRERVDEQRVLLQVFFQRRLFRYDLGGVVEGGASLVARYVSVLPVLGIVEPLVGIGECGAVGGGRGGGRSPLARAEAQHGAHEARARAGARCPHASRSRPAAAAARVGSIGARVRAVLRLSTAPRAAADGPRPSAPASPTPVNKPRTSSHSLSTLTYRFINSN